MNAGTVLAAKFATPTANRRKFLATSAALLAAPVSLRAGDVFVPHFLGANTAISGYGLFAAIDLLRKLGFQSIEIQNLLGTPEPTRDSYPGFRLDEADDDLKSRMWLYDYQDGDKPDCAADGFLGWIQQGQVFDFDDPESFRLVRLS